MSKGTTKANPGSVFDEIAEQYDQFRPSYPQELIAALIQRMDLKLGARVLEIGAGSGKATELLVPYGFQFSLLEPGSSFGRMLRRKYGSSSSNSVSVVEQSFEQFRNDGQAFDAVLAAQCFHWLRSELRLEKCRQLLAPGGWLGLIWNVSPRTESVFFRRLYALYDQLADGIREPTHVDQFPNEVVVAAGEEIRESNLFGDVELLRFPWTVTYSTTDFLGLINTYSNHRALPGTVRNQLYAGVKTLCAEHGDVIVKDYVAVLYLSRAI